jgi:hypothetical protein
MERARCHGRSVRLASLLVATVLLEGAAAAQCPLPGSGTTLPESARGDAVAVSGDTAVVGDPFSTSVGRAYVYERDLGGPGAWGLSRTLAPPDPTSYDRFGTAVAIDGDRVAVGAIFHGIHYNGAVYVFERDLGGPGSWGLAEKLMPVAPDGDFGTSLALHGDRMVVGAPETNSGEGAAYVYDWSPSTGWHVVVRLLAPSPLPLQFYGYDVGLWGDTAVVSEPYDGMGWFPGSVFVYERDLGGPNAWGKLKRLRGSDKMDGDLFGHSLELCDDTLVVAARDHDHAGVGGTGGVYVFERDLGGPDNWGERTELQRSPPAALHYFGACVALDGDALLVTDQPFQIERRVHVFERHSGAPDEWSHAGSFVGPPVDLFGFGYALGLDGNTALIGDPNADETYAYELSPTQPYTRYCTAGTSASGCRATLAACGVSSASAGSGFLLQASDVEGGKKGLFFYGTGGRQANPWGNGTSLQCVVPPVVRAGLLAGSGGVGTCDGSFGQDLNVLWSADPTKNPGAGATVQAQLWYRDPASTSNQTTSLSDALELQIGP